MPKFNFYFDKKISSWYRSLFQIEGDTYEDAEKKVKEMFDKGKLEEQNEEDGFVEERTEHDFDEFLTVEDNGGNHTEELLNSDFRTIKKNV